MPLLPMLRKLPVVSQTMPVLREKARRMSETRGDWYDNMFLHEITAEQCT
jgi:hypothetical protein